MRQPENLRFDDRVVVITGAGAGLGRAYALLFASRGANVVVNDLGVTRLGDGSSSQAADAVVEEIKALGGKAVANYDSVLDGANIVKTAVENFGRIDVLINNAGILRDKSFAKMSQNDWDSIQDVHLNGAFKTTKAAWPYFLKQNYGRIVVTSSNSGLYGNFGQANYSAAKMGLVGLANSLAIEGARKNIHTNVIVPTAASRLTRDILPPDMFDELKPELIAPVVAWLCHENCPENGSIIESALGWAGKCHLIRSNGATLRQNLSSSVTPEAVAENWTKVTDMSNSKHFENMQEATGQFMVAIEEMKSGNVAANFADSANSKNHENSGNSAATSRQGGKIYRHAYDKRDAILYALGVGASVRIPSDFRYLYECDASFAVLPTFYVLHGPIYLMNANIFEESLPNVQLDPTKMLHGEQYIEVFKEIPTEATVETEFKMADVLDKGTGAVFIIQHETFDAESRERLAFGQMSVFFVGGGGFGGERKSANAIPCVEPPNRAPDASISQETSHDQAALYRLSGDTNPLHIDPNLANLAGFKRPILHGLCSLGFSTRHVLRAYANGDPALFKAVKVRFARPVLPGQTLRTDMWRDGNRIHFRTSTTDENLPVITGGYVDLKDVVVAGEIDEIRVGVVDKEASDFSGESNSDGESKEIAAKAKAKAKATRLESDAVFERIEDYVKANPREAMKVDAVFLYRILVDKQPRAVWTLDLKKPEVYRGEPKSGKADATLIVEDSDMIQMALGKLNPQVAFMRGKLKINGNVMLTQKLKSLIEAGKSKL